MNRYATASLLVLSALSGLASGQPTSGQYPQCWMWSRPSASLNWTDTRFAPMARINPGCSGFATPQDAARKLAELARRLITSGQLPLDNPNHYLLGVSIQNFGMPQYGSMQIPLEYDWSLFNALDAVDVDTDGVAGADWSDSAQPLDTRLQPWMNEGRSKAKAWMTALVTEYKRLNNDSTEVDFYHKLPDWTRLHLDHESATTQLGTGNWPFLLEAMVMENDSPIGPSIIGISLA